MRGRGFPYQCHPHCSFKAKTSGAGLVPKQESLELGATAVLVVRRALVGRAAALALLRVEANRGLAALFFPKARRLAWVIDGDNGMVLFSSLIAH